MSQVIYYATKTILLYLFLNPLHLSTFIETRYHSLQQPFSKKNIPSLVQAVYRLFSITNVKGHGNLNFTCKLVLQICKKLFWNIIINTISKLQTPCVGGLIANSLENGICKVQILAERFCVHFTLIPLEKA